MKRAQTWVKGEMERIGLVNVAIEPFMDYGVAWDNEYVSLHLLEPDYQPMVGYPLANTPGTAGKVVAKAVIVDLQAKQDLEKYPREAEGDGRARDAAGRHRPGRARERCAATDRRGAAEDSSRPSSCRRDRQRRARFRIRTC